ncbi:putative Protein sprouty [Hypsibius exemplaris]|uniref:Protein sprouty n=1 Tax=Hypsibius exemplaris TaxID=2072580 RepID=A0A1W0WEL2_HYPEX|nr:putative Protein sprouty [Hypsibius exemplaris]
MDNRNGHHRTAPPTPSRDLIHAMQDHQRELARLERVRLDAPRPDAARLTNDYVDAPKLPLRKQPSSSVSRQEEPKSAKCGGDSHRHHHHLEDVPMKKSVLDTDHFLTKQPRRLEDSPPLPKRSPCAIHGPAAGRADEEDLKTPRPSPATSSAASSTAPGGIICPECGLCRCLSCLTPKRLPSGWMCNGNVECSADSLVEQLSCLCCVKAVFYHVPALSATDYSDDDEVAATADHPCTCTGSCQRWTVMGLLSVTCLPCLLCYWPLRACQAATEKCYAAYHRQGCRCRPQPSSVTPTSSNGSSPVASIRPLVSRGVVTRPGHARRVSTPPSGTTNAGFTGKGGVFL